MEVEGREASSKRCWKWALHMMWMEGGRGVDGSWTGVGEAGGEVEEDGQESKSLKSRRDEEQADTVPSA